MFILFILSLNVSNANLVFVDVVDTIEWGKGEVYVCFCINFCLKFFSFSLYYCVMRKVVYFFLHGSLTICGGPLETFKEMRFCKEEI